MLNLFPCKKKHGFQAWKASKVFDKEITVLKEIYLVDISVGGKYLYILHWHKLIKGKKTQSWEYIPCMSWIMRTLKLGLGINTEKSKCRIELNFFDIWVSVFWFSVIRIRFCIYWYFNLVFNMLFCMIRYFSLSKYIIL